MRTDLNELRNFLEKEFKKKKNLTPLIQRMHFLEI